MRRRTRPARGLLLALAVVGGTAGPALAAWDATSSGATGATSAQTLPAGPAPAATRLGRNVDVTFPQVAVDGEPLGARPGGQYELARTGLPAGGSCAGPLAAGSATTLTCRDSAVPPGTHQYAVTAGLHAWRGAAGVQVSVTVPTPGLTFSPPAWSGAGTPLQGSLDAFLDGAPLQYRLGNAATGPVLNGAPAGFPTAPASPVGASIPVGCGPASGTTHTVFAVSGGEQAAGTFTADFTNVLCPSSLGTTSGAVARRVGSGDTLAVSFSRPVNGETVCSGLTPGGSTPSSLRALVRDGGAGNDTLEVTAPEPSSSAGNACGSQAGVCVLVCLLGRSGTVNLGTLNLGSTQYATGGNVTLSASLALDGSGTVLTLTLGSTSAGTPGTAAATSVARYVPHSAIRSAAGSLAPTGFQTSGGPLF